MIGLRLLEDCRFIGPVLKATTVVLFLLIPIAEPRAEALADPIFESKFYVFLEDSLGCSAIFNLPID